MNNSSKFCLSIETVGQGFIQATNPLLCAKLLNFSKGLSLMFFNGFEVQDVRFPTNQVSSHLDFIYPLKLANKPKV